MNTEEYVPISYTLTTKCSYPEILKNVISPIFFVYRLVRVVRHMYPVSVWTYTVYTLLWNILKRVWGTIKCNGTHAYFNQVDVGYRKKPYYTIRSLVIFYSWYKLWFSTFGSGYIKLWNASMPLKKEGKGLVGKATRDTVQRSIGCGKEVVLTENMIKKCICIELPATSRFLDSRTSSRGSKNHRPSLLGQ